MSPLWIIPIALAAIAIGALIGYRYRQSVTEKKIGRTEEYAKKLLDDATRKAEDHKKEMILAAKEEILHLKTELDKESRARRTELQRSERRMEQREETLDKREAQLDKRRDSLADREESLNEKYADVQKLEEEAEAEKQKQITELERIATLTQDEARQMVIERVQKEAFHDAAATVREIESRAKEEGEKKARNIIALAIQKCAADHVAESTVSVINLPNDDMKGRIIGREGRNIRALETATGARCAAKLPASPSKS